MAQRKFESLWLKLLGGKPEHAGLGIMILAFFVAAIGVLIAFSASSVPERSALYWVGYAICATGIVGGWCGIIYHRILSQRNSASHRNDA